VKRRDFLTQGVTCAAALGAVAFTPPLLAGPKKKRPKPKSVQEAAARDAFRLSRDEAEQTIAKMEKVFDEHGIPIRPPKPFGMQREWECITTPTFVISNVEDLHDCVRTGIGDLLAEVKRQLDNGRMLTGITMPTVVSSPFTTKRGLRYFIADKLQVHVYIHATYDQS